ncbi:MAG: 50S ribosome-binding GTPase [Defluviitaleaceae bacterium]|nr:50S ribosome-binding GTPase [Defluviitaleaceae bacterium]
METKQTPPQAANALNMYIETISPMGNNIFVIGKIGSGTIKLNDHVSIVNQNATFCKNFTVAFIMHFDEGFISANKSNLANILGNITLGNVAPHEFAHENAEVGLILHGSLGDFIDGDYFLVSRAEHEAAQSAKLAENAEDNALRILITGTMSAGKSTLINAIIGRKPENDTDKTAAGTGAESKTAELAYFTNSPKPFKTWIKPKTAVTIIDTPGVNTARKPEHAEITRSAICGENAVPYDKLIYLFNADRLGTDDEMEHLHFVAENVPKEKTLFVLNKVDGFHAEDDSIRESLQRLHEDLRQLDYKIPRVLPISAHFALLLKLNRAKKTFTKKEHRDYLRYKAMFNENEYNLTDYYHRNDRITTKVANKMVNVGLEKFLFRHKSIELLAHKCGILGLEEILFGGHKK